MEIVRAAGIDGYDRVAEALGGRSLRTHRLTSYRHGEGDLADQCFRYSDVMDLLEATADSLNCADFGLQLATQQNSDVLGALGVAMRNAPTLRDAYGIAERYAHYHSPAIRFGLKPLPDPRFELLYFELAIADAEPVRRVQTFELSLGLTYRVMEQLSDGFCRPREIWFQHEPRSSLSRYRGMFGITPSFGRETCGIVIARNDLARDVHRSDDMVGRLANHYLDTICPARELSVTEQVARAIDMLMHDRDCTQTEVAAALGVRPRTLQRRLASERTSFEAIRDNVRLARARELLQSTTLSFSAISERLRYAEPSAFTRSCQRWFGQSPRQFRQALRHN